MPNPKVLVPGIFLENVFVVWDLLGHLIVFITVKLILKGILIKVIDIVNVNFLNKVIDRIVEK